MPLSGYLSLLRPGGHFILVGAPEKPLPQISPFELIPKHVALGGTMIVGRTRRLSRKDTDGIVQGSPSQIKEMLELAATQSIHPWIIKRPMDEVNQAVPDMHAGKARYRYVLVNEHNGGKL
jgi:alcohol dehydrogenase (NADP+)